MRVLEVDTIYQPRLRRPRIPLDSFLKLIAHVALGIFPFKPQTSSIIASA